LYQFPHYSDQVPDALKSGRCWVGCDADKVPYIVGTPWRASSTDPNTWYTYEQALKAYKAKRHVGIGRVFSEDDPFVGVDLDDIRKNQSEASIQLEAMQILRLLDSYSEVSPSGCGIKIWVRAALDRSYVKPDLEIYPHRRYFTVTGQFLPQASKMVEARQQKLEALIGREFPTPTVHLVRSGEYDGPEVDLTDYLSRVEVFGEVHDGHGIKYAIRCPWAGEHTNGTTGTYIGQRHNGATWFHCHHAHCHQRGWRDFKKKTLPGYRLMITRPGYTGNMEVRVNRG
jgi:hypothetical protein